MKKHVTLYTNVLNGDRPSIMFGSKFLKTYEIFKFLEHVPDKIIDEIR